MKHFMLMTVLALPAVAQWDEDIVIVHGTNGAAAAAAAPEVFTFDWSGDQYAPLRKEWGRIGRPRPRQFPAVWSSDAGELVPWQGTVTGTLAAATAPERRPMWHRLRQLLGKRPTERNVQRGLEDRRDSVAAAGTFAALKTNVVQFLDLLLAERAAVAEREGP